VSTARRRPDAPRITGALAAAVLFAACAGGPAAAQAPDPVAFLEAMVGEWSIVAEGIPGPGLDPVRTESREVARLLDRQWLVAEASAATPGGRPYTAIWTLGWNPHEERVVATWIASIQTHLWRFTGSLNESGTVLTLETEGPVMGGSGNTTLYRERIELLDGNRRETRSFILGPDGEWFEFARARYTREGFPEG
jgi:hypothetical protein